MNRVDRQIDLQSQENVNENPFFKIFTNLPESISDEEKTAIRTEAKEVIEEVIIPSYQLLGKYFKDEYLPQSRNTVGLYDTPEGRKLYEALARSFTTTNLSPKEIHQIGLDEVERIRGAGIRGVI